MIKQWESRQDVSIAFDPILRWGWVGRQHGSYLGYGEENAGDEGLAIIGLLEDGDLLSKP